MWDYSISADEMDDLLNGKIDKAGHYTREKLFAKMLSGLPWYAIIQILPVDIDLLGRAIVTIANDFLLGSYNSLGADKPSIKDAIVINLQPNI